MIAVGPDGHQEAGVRDHAGAGRHGSTPHPACGIPGGGQEQHLAGRHYEAPEHLLGRTVIIGTFQFRTRSEVATAEAAQLLYDLGMGHAICEVFPTGPTCEVCRLRLRSWNDVTVVIDMIRQAQRRYDHGVEYAWASRGRTLQESAWTGPISRAVRLLRAHVETEGMSVRVEGHYRQGQEAVYVKFPEQNNEAAILARGGAGIRRVDPVQFCKMGVLDIAAEEWLAALL